MEEKIQVQMTGKALFDFMLFHTYSKFAGFLTNILGAAVGFMGIIMFFTKKISGMSLLFYIGAAVVFIGYTPVLIKYRAHKQAAKMDIYRNAAAYTFHETDGIAVAQNGTVKTYPWETFSKVVVTPKTIGIYYKEDQALIIPKEDFKDRFVPVMKMVTSHVRPGKTVQK